MKEHTTQDQLNRHWRIVQTFDSYTEFSQSGKGLHIWVRGTVDCGRRQDGVEVYPRDHFMVCTGSVLINKPIEDRQSWLSILHAEIGRGAQPYVELNDVEDVDETACSIAKEAMDADGSFKNNEMGRLFAGNWEGRYESQSEADLALVKMFARMTKSNKVCWDAFLMSRLGERAKAERPDYRRLTLTTARTHLANDELKIAHGKQLAESMFWRPAAFAQVAPTPAPPVGQWGSAFRPHFPLLMDDDLMRMPEARWIVKGIIPAQGIGSVYGPSGSYKSFLNLDLLASISNGLWWFGIRTTPRPVVYVPFEGQSGVPNRIRAWRMAHPDKTSRIAFIYEGMNLRDPLDRAKLIKTLIESGWAGGVLCIDTLAQSGPGIEENSSEGMGEMIAIFNELQRKLGGVVLVVHHTGKDVDRGLRGWSGLLGALDFAIECEFPSTPRVGRFKLSKVKDGEPGRTFDFDMQIKHLYVDSDGDDVSSLAVQPKGKPAPSLPVDEKNDADDDFIWDWAKKMVDCGEHPSCRALQGYIAEMKQERPFTLRSIADAVARLKSAGRFLTEEEKGNPWLRPVELTFKPDSAAEK